MVLTRFLVSWRITKRSWVFHRLKCQFSSSKHVSPVHQTSAQLFGSDYTQDDLGLIELERPRRISKLPPGGIPCLSIRKDINRVCLKVATSKFANHFRVVLRHIFGDLTTHMGEVCGELIFLRKSNKFEPTSAG